MEASLRQRDAVAPDNARGLPRSDLHSGIVEARYEAGIGGAGSPVGDGDRDGGAGLYLWRDTDGRR